MKKRFVYLGICAVLLSVCLALAWRGREDSARAGRTSGKMAVLDKQVPLEYSDALMNEVLHIFEPWVWNVRKVNWGPEELVDRLWEQIEQRRVEDAGQVRRRADAWAWEYVDNMWRKAKLQMAPPWAAAGYIQIFTEPPGDGSLRGYAVILHGYWQYTYLVTDEAIYEVYSSMGLHTWQESMRELLQSVPGWQVTEEEALRYVHDFDLDKETLYGNYYEDIDRISVWYDDMNFLFTEKFRLLECQCSQAEPEEKRLRIQFRDMKDKRERELQFCAVEMPVYDSYEEWREYLQARHPKLRGCYFSTFAAGEYCRNPFITLETDEAQYGYFQRAGQWYQICLDLPGNGGYYASELVISAKSWGGYDSDIPSYWWRTDGKGNTIEADLTQDAYHLVEEISPGQVFSFECTMVRTQKNRAGEKVYQVAVTALGEDAPFQVLEVESCRDCGDDGFSVWDYDDAFYFVDFNADGYRDLESQYCYGAYGGSVITFVWSPSQGEFVRMPEELGNRNRSIYPEMRRFDLFFRGGRGYGLRERYQWSGEMDYERIRYMEYEYVEVYDEDDGRYDGGLYHVRIAAVDRGREKVLTDYSYDSDDDDAVNYVHLLYELDMAWEKWVTADGQDGRCILRYAQNREIDEDGQERYLDNIFLSREDTYLICTLPEQAAPAACSGLAWIEDTGQLAVSYEDGSLRLYQWNGAVSAFLSQQDN